MKKKYRKPIVSNHNNGSNLWPLSVAAAKAVGMAAGFALGALAHKGKIDPSGRLFLQKQRSSNASSS
ncbi:MAG: hypothetical protein VZR11_08010 [Succinimonas sp.]|nr:hypothetical protein [Succinimonas sp.]